MYILYTCNTIHTYTPVFQEMCATYTSEVPQFTCGFNHGTEGSKKQSLSAGFHVSSKTIRIYMGVWT